MDLCTTNSEEDLLDDKRKKKINNLEDSIQYHYRRYRNKEPKRCIQSDLLMHIAHTHTHTPPYPHPHTYTYTHIFDRFSSNFEHFWGGWIWIHITSTDPDGGLTSIPWFWSGSGKQDMVRGSQHWLQLYTRPPESSSKSPCKVTGSPGAVLA